MADEADRANDLAELHLRNMLNRRVHVDKNSGFCLNCGETSRGAYCCTEFREDHERIKSARVRNG